MAKRDTKFIWLLCGILVLGIAVGILLDPAVKSALAPTGEYNIQITEICAKNENIT